MSADDQSERLHEAVRRACADAQPLLVAGSGSKRFLLDALVSDGAALLSVAEHVGVVDYRPDELVVTVRTGTPLHDLQGLLDANQQLLPFDPPRFEGGGTIGGAIASGLAGPARPWRGSVRDCLLGVELVNGVGERLRFGGQVMKNVAGYDVSRLQSGAFGSLGVLLTVSLRLLPKPAVERTCALELDAPTALARMRQWARQPLPLTGVGYQAGVLWARLAGSEPAVAAALAELGGEPVADGASWWDDLRDHTLPVFKGDAPLLRVIVPPSAPAPLEGSVVEWAGGLRWFAAEDAAHGQRLAAEAEAHGGYAFGFDGRYARVEHSVMAEALRIQQRRIKHAFDPQDLFNRGLVEMDAD